jgi:sugar phosphate isomerase/epimerase
LAQESPQEREGRHQAMSRVVEAGFDLRACQIAGQAYFGAGQGESESEWRKRFWQHVTYMAWLAEGMEEARRDLIAAGLWPWPDAGPGQEHCTQRERNLPE